MFPSLPLNYKILLRSCMLLLCPQAVVRLNVSQMWHLRIGNACRSEITSVMPLGAATLYTR